MDLGDGRGRQRRAFEGGEQFVDPGAAHAAGHAASKTATATANAAHEMSTIEVSSCCSHNAPTTPVRKRRATGAQARYRRTCSSCSGVKSVDREFPAMSRLRSTGQRINRLGPRWMERASRFHSLEVK